jgi:hypothetical protein
MRLEKRIELRDHFASSRIPGGLLYAEDRDGSPADALDTTRTVGRQLEAGDL